MTPSNMRLHQERTCTSYSRVLLRGLKALCRLHRRSFGWGLPEKVAFDWEKLVTAVQDHIGSLNWGYRVALREKSVKVRTKPSPLCCSLAAQAPAHAAC